MRDEQCTERCGKNAVHVPRTSRHHVQREGNSTKNHLSDRERRDEREVYRKIPERRSERKVPGRNC